MEVFERQRQRDWRGVLKRLGNNHGLMMGVCVLAMVGVFLLPLVGVALGTGWIVALLLVGCGGMHILMMKGMHGHGDDSSEDKTETRRFSD